jgi:tRNA-modifying protein YgfZ
MAHPSPLSEVVRRLDAAFTESAGWDMPAHFGGTAAEYRSTLEGASLFDRSHQGKLELTGPEAPAFLHNLCTNDINNLPLGGGCEAYFCDRKAKVLGHAFIYHVLLGGNQHALLLDVTPAYAGRLLGHMDRHLISEQVEMADRTEQFAQMHLAGPKAKEVLQRALGEPLPPLAEFQHMERTFGANVTCHVRRNDPLGVPGFDIVCTNGRAEAVWQLLLACSARPAGLDAYEILRVEAGTPVYGVDIDENRFVMEVARPLRAVSYSKGCFLGQEPIVMARDRAGHVNRAFLGLKVLEGAPLPAGAKLRRDGDDVGVVTSSVHSLRLGAPIALGYLRRGHQETGTRLEAETPAAKQPVEVLGFPPISS